MLRLIVRTDDAAMAANCGGAVLTHYRTFDVDLPEVEAALKAGGCGENGFSHSQLIGAEILWPKEEP